MPGTAGGDEGGGGPSRMAVSTRHRAAGTNSPQRGHGSFSALGAALNDGKTVLQKGQFDALGSMSILFALPVRLSTERGNAC
jgi:hypothetical protein